ncbi:MAG: MarR family transcriptional regulator [Chloroflexi bacterium]|nr:MarR family transcriptional regulator [Chloroflexota bacterium]MCI0776199.1 MarR family transcriptional regulator [Chloroflexota bacterium]MCI0805183.1 MarR family transcriptional regulator [Chloroflexota bacterium]MCI0808249.1 MarR family transcriptional regulator [Chloroflexota bacterium]MCI0835429.1 MarR family transcriptional regulator [Chloroflexota bacterium]
MAVAEQVTAGVAWERTLRAVSRLLRVFDRELQDDVDLPLTWYDVLVQLYSAPDVRLRMQTLSDSLVLTRSGATRLVDRIEKAGLVRREPAAEDRRGYYAILTADGQRLMERAQKAHGAGIERHFGKHLDPDEQKTLFAIMSKLLAGNQNIPG